MNADRTLKAKNPTMEIDITLAERLIERCSSKAVVLSTAESCTGGLLSAVLTSVAGSSVVFDRSFITYSNDAKRQMLDVNQATLLDHGAVSEQVAMEMLHGALARSNAMLSVAITGIAGPGGGSVEKPVGTVCFAWGGGDNVVSTTEQFQGSRDEIRNAAVNFSLMKLMIYVESE